MSHYLLLLLMPCLIFGKQTICLNMIVKDEADVIERCLSSVKHLIDYWVIVDTGSQDKTKTIIQDYLKEIPGELHESTWKNFGWNRSEAYNLAKNKGDYILFMDADDVLEFEAEAQIPELKADLYNMWRGWDGFTYFKPQLVKGSLPWKWIGVTHEYLDCDQPYSSDLLSGIKYISKDGGASRKDPIQKFSTNIALLTEGLKAEPNNVRYAFYLAESYRDVGEPAKALEWYQKRVAMGGWAEETFWAKFQIALMLQKIGLPSNVVIEAFLDAHRYRPHRVEPVYYIAEILNQEGNYLRAYEYLKSVAFIPKPAEKDILFNMDWMEKYGIAFQLGICSYYLGHYEESIKYCDQVLSTKGVPENWRKQAAINREFPALKLQEKLIETIVQ